ncbi:response regulator [Oceanicola sp. 22II-s10i]|uniref:response regulator n=1 Tax=Oceanicola sp. 22II-s10i TaxID=1317116 RepID=UPI000B525635|nr:response regulator [Oceanicola sp. 22II-s10i]OWU86579.1 response regulator [Oceanicola sp. 22II-s10i]
MDITDSTGPRPTADRPLLGMTVLVVEDSRFASEALRLLCLRSGARIRRADCLMSARRHLQVYRPTVVIADLGLPDGSGADLIAELAATPRRVEVLLGLSGDDGGEALARGAGADGFLAKPVESLARFQTAILNHLPHHRQPAGPRMVTAERVEPDRIAFREDMEYVAEMIDGVRDDAGLDYVAQFLGAVARSASDAALADAAGALADARRAGRAIQPDVARLAGLVQARLSMPVAI